MCVLHSLQIAAVHSMSNHRWGTICYRLRSQESCSGPAQQQHGILRGYQIAPDLKVTWAFKTHFELANNVLD